MTQDEIIEMAMAYGFTGGFDANGNQTYDATFVKAVAEAVAKEREACFDAAMKAAEAAIDAAITLEREACARFLETTDICGDAVMDELAEAIRARGEA